MKIDGRELKKQLESFVHDEDKAITMMNLYDRWQDEKDYEDFAEYVAAMVKGYDLIEKALTKGTKRPFGFKVESSDGFKGHIKLKVTRSDYVLQGHWQMPAEWKNDKKAAPKESYNYKVNMKAVINPDFLNDHELDHVDFSKPTIDYNVKCETLSECSIRCRMFIKKHNLGCGNWAGGQIWDADGNKVGHVSYNGRIWDENDKEIDVKMTPVKEPKINKTKADKVLGILKLTSCMETEWIAERLNTSKASVQSMVSRLRKDGHRIDNVDGRYVLRQD